MIDVGSRVKLLWVGNQVSFGIVTRICHKKGDLLHIEKDGLEHIINPHCRDLCEIIEINKKKESER